jgi:predicted TIM-barrel fold metal-dependent hydrolase
MALYPRIDGHVHLWADDHARYPMGRLIYPGDKAEPGPGPNSTWTNPSSVTFPGQLDYYKQGTSRALLRAQAEVGVHAAHAIQVVFHGYDESYIEDCIAQTPLRLRGSHVCDPASTPELEVARVDRLHSQGFTGVRFKPNLWADAGRPVAYNDDVGHAVAQACGERRMPVAILSRFTVDTSEAEQIERLVRDFPQTQIIIDHFGGGPTPGALQSAPNWNRFLALSKFDNVAVKVSGWHPHGATGSAPIPRGGKDDYDVAGTACLELLGCYGADRLMYGTNFPEPAVYCDETKGYQRQWHAFDEWCSTHVSANEAQLLAGGTCGRLYQFDMQKLLQSGPVSSTPGKL